MNNTEKLRMVNLNNIIATLLFSYLVCILMVAEKDECFVSL